MAAQRSYPKKTIISIAAGLEQITLEAAFLFTNTIKALSAWGSIRMDVEVQATTTLY